MQGGEQLPEAEGPFRQFALHGAVEQHPVRLPRRREGRVRNAREAALFQPRRARVQPSGAQKTREMGVAPVAAGDENIHKTATFPMRHPMPGGGAGCALYTGGVFLYNRRERKRRMRHAQGLAAAAAHLPACEPVRPGAGGAARLFLHGHLHDHLLRGRKRRRSAGCGGGARVRAGGAVVGDG